MPKMQKWNDNERVWTCRVSQIFSADAFRAGSETDDFTASDFIHCRTWIVVECILFESKIIKRPYLSDESSPHQRGLSMLPTENWLSGKKICPSRGHKSYLAISGKNYHTWKLRGNVKEHSNWARERHNWIMQYSKIMSECDKNTIMDVKI